MCNNTNLAALAAEIRLTTLREFKTRGFGHVGGAMSIVEVLSVLYGKHMKIDPKNPKDPNRDWLVVSKGHAGPALYATLALKGFFDLALLDTLNKPGTILPSHCDMNKTPGVDMTTGSLGQSISTAIGVAMGNRLDNRANTTYLIIGDGECNEGQIWEGAMLASHFKLDNFVLFVDYNKQQLDGYTKNVLDMGDFGQKFDSFGFFTQVVDGHDVCAIDAAIQNAKNQKGKPAAIILDTVKGKGCFFAEDVESNHHIAFTDEQIDKAIAEAQTALENAEKAQVCNG